MWPCPRQPWFRLWIKPIQGCDQSVRISRSILPSALSWVVIGGLFLATLVYVLQRRAFRRRSGLPRTQFPPHFRAAVHILIALVVGLVVGYHCASPLDLTTIIVVPVTLLLGGIASAYTELANPRLDP